MTFVYFYGNEIVRKEKYGENGKSSAESIILSRLPFVYILTTIKFLLEKEYIDDAKGLMNEKKWIQAREKACLAEKLNIKQSDHQKIIES